MTIILPLLRLSTPLTPEWHTPLALMPLANGTVVGQLLESALKTHLSKLVCLVANEPTAAALADWADEALPDTQMTTVVVGAAHSLVRALWAAREHWQNGEVLLLTDERVVDVELGRLVDEAADVVLIDPPHETGGSACGIAWFRRGDELARLLGRLTAAQDESTVDLAQAIDELRPARREARLSLPLLHDGRPDAHALLEANARLLGFGRSSAEAIERSYGEEFTVIPPVYLHEDAVVESSVIASHTSIGAAAVVRNAVLSRCLVGPGTIVEDITLDNALIGPGAVVRGEARSLILPDGQFYAG